jgi:hypothetical protein
MNRLSGWITSVYDYANQYLVSEETKEKRKIIKKLKKRALTVEDKALSEFLDADEKELIKKLPKALPETTISVQPIVQEEFIVPENIKESQKLQIKQYLKDRINLLVMSIPDMVYFVNQINRYYKITYKDYTKEEISKIGKDAIERIFNLLISLDKNLYFGQQGLYYKKDLNLFNLEFPISELNKIILNVFGLSDIKKDSLVAEYFPTFLLTNVFISTTKVLFDCKISIYETATIRPFSLNYERTSLGSQLYFEYFFQNYKDLCFISSYMDEIINLATEINVHNKKYSHVSFDKFKYGGEQRYIKILYRLGYENDYINCNIYVHNLLSYVIEKHNMFSGISYDDKFEKYMRLKSEKDLEDKIKKCLGSSQRYILIPLKLTKKEWNGQSHQNILLVDRERKLVERFEPHGSISARKDKDLNFELMTFFLKLGLEYKIDLCSASGVQETEIDLPEGITGKCVSLSYGYLNHRLEQMKKLSPEKGTTSTKKRKYDQTLYPAEFAPIAYYNQINEKGVTHWIDIEDLNKKIFNQQQIYLDKINQKFGSSLCFHGNTLTFQNSKCKK